MTQSQAFVRRPFDCDTHHKHDLAVEYGADKNLSEPAFEILEELREMRWENKRLPKYPDEAQFHAWHKLVGIIDAIAAGYEIEPHEFNYLRAGVWEIKFNNVRITFYDTDGHGGYSPKEAELAGYDWRGKPQWYFPDLDDIVRLGGYWEKLGQTAGEFNVRRAITFRSEDVQHDSTP